jgi:hypothetical protein
MPYLKRPWVSVYRTERVVALQRYESVIARSSKRAREVAKKSHYRTKKREECGFFR